MNRDEHTDDELEAREEERRHRGTIKSLDDLRKRYKALFGYDPDKSLPIAEIQAQIITEMTRRNLRPYKL